MFEDAQGTIWIGTAGGVMTPLSDRALTIDVLERWRLPVIVVARTRLGNWLRYWVGMANRGILPMAPSVEDIWTVSVQHTEADVEATIRAFRDVAPLLA